MNVLVIDFQIPHLPRIEHKSLNYRYIGKPYTDWDSFIDKEFSNIFEKVTYDLIVLPYSLSNNYFEFSGIRAAAHIRCTSNWHNTHTPILFWGNEDASIVARYDKLGILLFSQGTRLFNGTDLLSWLSEHSNSIQPMTKNEYLETLDKLSIKAPKSLGGRHSIANLWCVLRWSEMMQIQTKDTTLQSSIYYKYERSRSGDTEPFNRKWLKNKGQNIPKIVEPPKGKGKWKIAYIDDEYLFWFPLLSVIAPKEYADIICFSDFRQIDSQEILLKKIEMFIAKQDADCYIVDLRLHHCDFEENHEKLTGHLVGECITNNNRANQIVYFTASNKIWNYFYTRSENRQFELAIKESPDLHYNRNQTYSNYIQFVSSLNLALKDSYIKTYLHELQVIGCTKLSGFIDLLLLYQRNKKLVLPSIILSEIVFIEEYLKTKYSISGGTITNEDSNEQYKVSDLIVCKSEKSNGYSSVTMVKFVDRKQLYPGYEKLGENTDIYRIVAPLRYVYHFPERLINLVVKAKYIRNTRIAHASGIVDFNLEEVKEIFEEIILKILKNDR